MQLVCFGLGASAGIVGSVALLFGHPAGRRILRALSWLGFVYFSGSGLLVPVFHVVRAPEVTWSSFGFVSLIAGMIAVVGVPFLYMARRLSERSGT